MLEWLLDRISSLMSVATLTTSKISNLMSDTKASTRHTLQFIKKLKWIVNGSVEL